MKLITKKIKNENKSYQHSLLVPLNPVVVAVVRLKATLQENSEQESMTSIVPNQKRIFPEPQEIMELVLRGGPMIEILCLFAKEVLPEYHENLIVLLMKQKSLWEKVRLLQV